MLKIDKFLKNQKNILIRNLMLGLILLCTGVYFLVNNMTVVPNNKAVIALSLLPFGVVLSAVINLLLTKKRPHDIEKVLVHNSDERIKKIRHKAEAKTLQILSWALSIVFFGYTLSFPSHVFVTVTWWFTFLFMIAPDLLSVVLELFYNTKGYQEE